MCESNPVMPDVYASILLMAFMFDDMKAGQEFTDLCKETWEGTIKIASGIKDGDKVKFACGLAAENNQHSQKCILAGGEYAFKGCGETPNQWGSYNPGDWLYKQDIDCFINISNSNRTMGSFFDKNGPDAGANLADVDKYSKLEVYKTGDFDFVYGGLPLAFDPLLRGYAMYPDLYADFYEKQLDSLFEMLGTNVAGEKFADMDLQMVISLDEMQKLAKA